MPDTSTGAPPRRSRPGGLLLGGAVLTGVGGLLAAVGTSCIAAAALGAARRWQQATDMSPGQLARHAVSATLVGAGAGAQAWRRAPGEVDLVALVADGARDIPAPRAGDDRVGVPR